MKLTRPSYSITLNVKVNQTPIAELSCTQTDHACADHEVVAKLAELDMVVADLEHANSRVATVERRNVCILMLPAAGSTEADEGDYRNFFVLRLRP